MMCGTNLTFQTGELDNETMKWMHMPRCGVKDIIGSDHKDVRRKKRYVLQGNLRNM